MAQKVIGAFCVQVGRGLTFLHASGIVHGNLSSSTVLLRNSTLDRRGFIAKIGAPLHRIAPAESLSVTTSKVVGFRVYNPQKMCGSEHM